MKKKKAIIDVVTKSWTTEEIVNAWNYVCEYYDNLEDKVWEVNGQDSPDVENRCILISDDFAEASNRSKGLYFNPDDKYFWFGTDNKNNLIVRSGDYPQCDPRSPINVEDIVDFIIENGEYLEKIDKLALYYIFANEYFRKDSDAFDVAFGTMNSDEINLITDDWDKAANKVKDNVKKANDFIAEQKKYREKKYREKSISGEA